MSQAISITVEHGLIRVLYRGTVEYGATTAMLRNVARIGAETQSRLLLFDIRESDHQNYYTETVRHAQEGPALGINQKTFRIAFLGSERNPMLQFIEDVTVNRGFQVKVFTEEAAALAWLRGTP